MAISDLCAYPSEAVLVEGTAETTEEQADEVALAICLKYLGQERGQATFRTLRDESPLVLIRVRPAKLMHFHT